MPLVMLGGAADAYNKEVERKRQQAADILLALQKYLMETGLQKFQAIKKSEKESKARISKGVTLGFDRKAALALEMSGELDSVITRLTKLREDPDKRLVKQTLEKCLKLYWKMYHQKNLHKLWSMLSILVLVKK